MICDVLFLRDKMYSFIFVIGIVCLFIYIMIVCFVLFVLIVVGIVLVCGLFGMILGGFCLIDVNDLLV